MSVRSIKGFSLTEIAIVIAILTALSAIAVTAFSPMREKSRQSACASQLRQAHQAVMMYTSDVDAGEEVPGLGPLACGALLNGLAPLKPYVSDRRVFFCPDFPGALMGKVATSYVWVPVPSYLVSDPSQGEAGMLQEQADRIAKDPSGFPLWLCRSHDEVFYQPREDQVNVQFAQPFVIEVSVSGSLYAGRRPYLRTHLIEAYSRK